jgi:hypothetical protein
MEIDRVADKIIDWLTEDIYDGACPQLDTEQKPAATLQFAGTNDTGDFILYYNKLRPAK